MGELGFTLTFGNVPQARHEGEVGLGRWSGVGGGRPGEAREGVMGGGLFGRKVNSTVLVWLCAR